MWQAIDGCYCGMCRAVRAAAEQPTPAVEVKEVPTSRVLTREMVLRAKPCKDYRHLFIERFPVAVEVTKELALSQIDDWDWSWAGSLLLSRKAALEFDRRSDASHKVYEDAMAPYRAALNKAYDLYYRAHNEAMREARDRGLGYTERYEYAVKTAKPLMEVEQAAMLAVEAIFSKRRRVAEVLAFVELFLADEEAYTEQHRNDAPFVEPERWDDEYDEEDVYDDYEEEDTDY